MNVSNNMENKAPEVSVIIPLYNEEECVEELYRQVLSALKGLDKTWEVIFIDDGSTDETFAILSKCIVLDGRQHIIRFRRNFGQSAALAAGFDHASGAVLIPMDGDLQNDPSEIPKLLHYIDEGYDIASGWRKERQDSFFRRRLPSMIANRLISWVTQVHLHDSGCTLKAYRREVLQDLKLYGELHRYIPVLAHWKGYRIAEVPVQHQPRRYGQSKYGFRRLGRSYIDFLSVLFMTSYLKRPMQLFGMAGTACAAVGALVMLYLAALWLIKGGIGWRPLLFFGTTALVVGIQLISVGLLGEMLRHITFRAEEEYSIRQVWEDISEGL